MAEASASSGHRRWRGRRKLSQGRRTALEAIAFVTILFFLGWGADSLARLGAESLLARNIQNATGVIEPPTVAVRGFAVVPQVVRGAYNEVDVTTRGITSGPLRIDQVDSQLFDVRVPFHDVLLQDIRRVGIGRSVEDVTLRYADLNAYFKATGRPFQLGAAETGKVQITGPVNILGQGVQVSADASLSVSDGALRITPDEIRTGDTALNQASRLLLGQRLRLTVPLGTLPFGHQLTSAAPDANGIHLQAEGTAIIVEP
jgi:LmeA-like phospholipid-binding